MDLHAPIRAAIEAARAERGWSYREVARRANVDSAGLTRYLKSERDLGDEAIGRVLAAFGLVAEVSVKASRQRA